MTMMIHCDEFHLGLQGYCFLKNVQSSVGFCMYEAPKTSAREVTSVQTQCHKVYRKPEGKLQRISGN